MKAFLFSFCYNILYTVGWLVTLPSYLLKQKRRGGFGTGLLERFAERGVVCACRERG